MKTETRSYWEFWFACEVCRTDTQIIDNSHIVEVTAFDAVARCPRCGHLANLSLAMPSPFDFIKQESLHSWKC